MVPVTGLPQVHISIRARMTARSTRVEAGTWRNRGTCDSGGLEDCSVRWSEDSGDPHCWTIGVCPDPVRCPRVALAEDVAYRALTVTDQR